MMLQVVRIYLLLLAIPAVYAVTAWLLYRRFGLPALVALWATSSILYGYLSFRGTCARPITCDVGPDPYSLYYLTHVAPPFALAAALAFGTVSAVVVRRSRRFGGVQLGPRDLTLSTLAGVAAFIVGALIFHAPVW